MDIRASAFFRKWISSITLAHIYIIIEVWLCRTSHILSAALIFSSHGSSVSPHTSKLLHGLLLFRWGFILFESHMNIYRKRMQCRKSIFHRSDSMPQSTSSTFVHPEWKRDISHCFMWKQFTLIRCSSLSSSSWQEWNHYMDIANRILRLTELQHLIENLKGVQRKCFKSWFMATSFSRLHSIRFLLVA
jgi:hypothetical protein